MSTPTQSQSRDTILNSFHEITGFNIEDCIHLLNQYNWKLQVIVDDYYDGKVFKGKFTQISNEKAEKNHKRSSHNSNLGDFYAKNNRNQQSIEEDRNYALVLEKYGDIDDFVRRQSKDGYQHQQQPPRRSGKREPIYHEKQEFLRCGIHSLNNLFQTPHMFTHQFLDSIVYEFDKRYIDNDYGKFWIGDYDLRVLIEAIERCGYQVGQINLYDGKPLENLSWDSYFGLLINLNGVHWFTIKNLNGSYYNLDSTFSKPLHIGQKYDLVNYLIHLIQKFRNVYIFTVSRQTNSNYHL